MILLPLFVASVALVQVKSEYCYYREGKELEEGYLDCGFYNEDEPIEGIALIHLKHNTTIPVIKNDLLSPFKNLKTLYITAANVERIEKGAFENLTLEMVDFYHNNLKSIENGTFNFLKDLKYLDLSYNKFETLLDTTFSGLVSLKWLSLNSNSIKSIHKEAFSDLKNLKSLYLVFNQISHLDSEVLKSLESLELLDLSYNALSSIPKDLFKNQTKLQYLFLKHNLLVNLPDDLFKHLNKLIALDLSQNRIEKLQDKLFYHTESLKFLLFNSNQVSEFNSTSLLEHSPDLQEVHLFHNRWKCINLRNITNELRKRYVFLATSFPVLASTVGGIGCHK